MTGYGVSFDVAAVFPSSLWQCKFTAGNFQLRSGALVPAKNKEDCLGSSSSEEEEEGTGDGAGGLEHKKEKNEEKEEGHQILAPI